jgi:uncharacterized membrane protein
MNPTLLQVLRLVHVLSASFWVGTAATLGFFVMPAVLASDITAARFLTRVMIQRKLRIYILFAMLLTLLSGTYLYWHDFGGMGPPVTRAQVDFSLGGLFGLLAGLVIIFVNAPTGMKLAAVMDSVGTGVPTEDQADHITRLSRKLLIATRSVAILTLGAAALMALARFAG